MADNQHSTNSFTRGSQIFMHTLRMMAQGTKVAVLLSLLLLISWLIFRCSQKLYLKDCYYLLAERWATIKLSIGNKFYPAHKINVTVYDFLMHKIRVMPALEFKARIWQSKVGVRLGSWWEWVINYAAIEAGIVFSFGLISTYTFFVFRGRATMGKKKTRGGELISARALTKRLKKAGCASNITIGGLPIVKNSERQHILVTGTTGTGKTNLIHEIIPQLKKRGDRAIIVDVNGSFIGAYCKPDQDLILNPFDKRTVHWLPWADCKENYDYDAIAKALIGENSHHESFWEDSAEKILSEALKRSKVKSSIAALLYILNQAPLETYSEFFKNSIVASLTAKEGDKTITSIRASLNNKIKPLSHLLETTDPFSLKEYVLSDQKEWLYITAMPIQRQSLGPLLATWIEIILQGLMMRDITKTTSNLWIIIDELPSLGKVPSLKTALAESRKYGGCLIAGIQNIHQLKNIYGRNEAHDLLDQFNNRFVFRVGDQETAQITANMLGEQESREAEESLSYGANTVRDGINISTVERKNLLVLPTEIMNLSDLSCYVKLAGNWPVTNVKLKYHKRNYITKIFEGLCTNQIDEPDMKINNSV